MIARLKRWALALRADLLALWFSRSHPDTPLLAKIVAALVVAYAFSPIDLIPDFIPVLGQLDDLILVPLGITIALRLIPDHVLAVSRQKAQIWLAEKKKAARSYAAAVLIVAIWLALAYWGWMVVAKSKKP